MHYQKNEYQMIEPQESSTLVRKKDIRVSSLKSSKLITVCLEGLLRSPLYLTSNFGEMFDVQIGFQCAMWNQ